ncbi:Suppressor protein stp22 of temperature-sensitive alpha-factor receptor and arginine permease [Elasticomyces elasticus]|nr:Suppressor protein stp22 of temperature-sensitive alpha-factor receptor and arginine permease [Elasticomyces elasticus]
MSVIPEKTLGWLYSVLTGEYHDPDRTYTDVVQALSRYASLAPRTDVYTDESGRSALLLCLRGTIPAIFRAKEYRFPVKVWVPHAYPREGITVFVDPGDNGERSNGVGAALVVRPGQHVAADGKIYHPYLRDWGRWQGATLVEFLGVLQDVFAKEPPVLSKQQQQQYRQGRPPQAAPLPPAPPPPPKQQEGDTRMAELASGGPPRKPPKPSEIPATPTPRPDDQQLIARNGPPLPPLPQEQQQWKFQSVQEEFQRGAAAPPRPSSERSSQRHGSLRASGGPPLPPLPPHVQRQYYYQDQRDDGPVSPISPNRDGHIELPTSRHSLPLPPAIRSGYSQQNGQQQTYIQQPQHQYQTPPSTQPYPPHQQGFYPQSLPQQAPGPPQPPPDLLSDPFEITLPTTQAATSTPGSAPPIPPNPEREHLLHAISQAMYAQLIQTLDRNAATLAPLQAQHAALLAAQSRMQSELQQLQQLDTVLSKNEEILHNTISAADHIIATSKSRPPPNIDDILIPPTVVSQQLWNLMAEEAGLKEARWVLSRAVDEGRVGGETFIKLTRSLAREEGRVKMLGRKVAKGLGLEIGNGMGRRGGEWG